MSTLRFEKNGNIGSITLTDPPDNKIGSAFNRELREALHEVAVSDVRALVIRSEGENFCNGPMCLNLPSWNRKYFVPWSMKYTHRFVFWNLFEFLQLLRYKAWRWAAGSNLLSRAIFLWLKPQQRSSQWRSWAACYRGRVVFSASLIA